MTRRILLALAFAATLAAQTFIQMTDPQFGMYTGNKGFAQETANFEFAVATANRLKPAFVVVTGDLVNEAGNAAQIAEFKRVAGRLDPSIRLFLMPGNHDVGNEPTKESLAKYREQFGPDYYTFRVGDITGIALNSNLEKGAQNVPGEAAKMEAWFRAELAQGAAGRGETPHRVPAHSVFPERCERRGPVREYPARNPPALSEDAARVRREAGIRGPLPQHVRRARRRTGDDHHRAGGEARAPGAIGPAHGDRFGGRRDPQILRFRRAAVTGEALAQFGAEAEGSVFDAETLQRRPGGFISGGGCLAIPGDGLVAVPATPSPPSHSTPMLYIAVSLPASAALRYQLMASA